MKCRRQIPGVLRSWLDTLVSRYTDYDGYWVWGMLQNETHSLDISIKGPDSNLSLTRLQLSLLGYSRRRAQELFDLSPVPFDVISELSLSVQTMPDRVMVRQGTHISNGFITNLAACATSDLNKKYRVTVQFGVAPHSFWHEHRSSRTSDYMR
jgi:hypothetical protein